MPEYEVIDSDELWRRQLKEDAGAWEIQLRHELEAEDAFWDKLTKEGRIKGPDY